MVKKKGGTNCAYGTPNNVCRCTIPILRMKIYDRNGRDSSVDIEKISLLQVRLFDVTRYSRASLHSVQPRYLLCGTFSDRSVYSCFRIQQPLERTLRRLRTVAGSPPSILVLLLSPLQLTKSYNRHFLI